MLILVNLQSLEHVHRYVTYKNALAQLYATSLLTSMVLWKSRLVKFSHEMFVLGHLLFEPMLVCPGPATKACCISESPNPREFLSLTSCIYRNHHEEDCQTQSDLDRAANDFDETVQLYRYQ